MFPSMIHLQPLEVYPNKITVSTEHLTVNKSLMRLIQDKPANSTLLRNLQQKYDTWKGSQMW